MAKEKKELTKLEQLIHDLKLTLPAKQDWRSTDGQEIEFGEGDVLPKLGRLARVRKELHARSMVAEVIRLDNRTRPSWVAVQLTVKKP